MRFPQIKGVGVGLASQILFHPPLKRFDGFMLRLIVQSFRPKCRVCMWILHTEIQDDIQNGRQNGNFSDNSPKILKIKVKMPSL